MGCKSFVITQLVQRLTMKLKYETSVAYINRSFPFLWEIWDLSQRPSNKKCGRNILGVIEMIHCSLPLKRKIISLDWLLIERGGF